MMRSIATVLLLSGCMAEVGGTDLYGDADKGEAAGMLEAGTVLEGQVLRLTLNENGNVVADPLLYGVCQGGEPLRVRLTPEAQVSGYPPQLVVYYTDAAGEAHSMPVAEAFEVEVPAGSADSPCRSVLAVHAPIALGADEYPFALEAYRPEAEAPEASGDEE